MTSEQHCCDIILIGTEDSLLNSRSEYKMSGYSISNILRAYEMAKDPSLGCGFILYFTNIQSGLKISGCQVFHSIGNKKGELILTLEA